MLYELQLLLDAPNWHRRGEDLDASHFDEIFAHDACVVQIWRVDCCTVGGGARLGCTCHLGSCDKTAAELPFTRRVNHNFVAGAKLFAVSRVLLESPQALLESMKGDFIG